MKKLRRHVQILNDLQGSGARVESPERLLWLTVVAQAVVDATSPAATRERARARSVIFSSVGTTVCHFRAICDWAGVNPHFVVRFTREAISEGKSIPQLAVSYALSLGKEP